MELIKVLVVEDDPDLREILVDQLSEKFKVEGAENGQVALDKMPTFQPDVIVSDIRMPRLDGLGLFNAVCKLPPPPVPILFMSGYIGDAQISHLKTEKNFMGFLSKPVDITEITNLLTKVEKAKIPG